MRSDPGRLSRTFTAFFDSEKSGGILLVLCTVISLLVANSDLGSSYLGFWNSDVGGRSMEHWVNDALMALFFLLIGLELERELYNGELSSFRTALLPIVAAAGGMIAPALIHFSLNAGTPTQAGIGIPMATDIAFALGVLAMLGSRVPASLKVFLVALAVMDDLGAIVFIAVFYTEGISAGYLAGALAVFCALVVLNRQFRVMSLVPYLAGGVLLWLLLDKSGVHATISGVLLAFAIPFSARQDDEQSPSHQLEHFLQRPVAFVILPMFALANTGIVIDPVWLQRLVTANCAGIIGGLAIGKPLGITLLSFAVVSAGICRLPADLTWKHVVGAGLLGGIGFTMSVFIANLAFAGDPETISSSKMAIMLASVTAGIAGFAWLKLLDRPKPADADLEARDPGLTDERDTSEGNGE